MKTNAVITIFNRSYNLVTKAYEYKHQTILRNVSYRETGELLSTDKGIEYVKMYYVRIPVDVITDKIYIKDRDDWNNFPNIDMDKYYTVQEQDYIVRDEITKSYDKISDMLKEYEDKVGKITLVSDNRDERVSRYMRHIRVVAK